MSIVAQEHAWCATTPKRSAVPDPNGSGLKSVGSALDVLECFATDGELGVSDIARRLGVAKSTAHRLLQTLASRGFVEQVAHSAQYRLGMHVYELGALAQGVPAVVQHDGIAQVRASMAYRCEHPDVV